MQMCSTLALRSVRTSLFVAVRFAMDACGSFAQGVLPCRTASPGRATLRTIHSECLHRAELQATNYEVGSQSIARSFCHLHIICTSYSDKRQEPLHRITKCPVGSLRSCRPGAASANCGMSQVAELCAMWTQVAPFPLRPGVAPLRE